MTQQLSLFGATAEAGRVPRENYDAPAPSYRALEVRCQRLEARLERAKEEFRALREERNQAVQKVWEAWRERDAARTDARHWQSMYEIATMLRPSAPQQSTTSLEPTLKRLLSIAHPDRWQRGQPATELAHELAITINSLREGGRP